MGRTSTEINRERYKNDPKFRAEAKRRATEWMRGEGRTRSYNLKKRYGITQAQYQEMLVAQDNKCAVCGNHFSKTPHVDHNHITGEVRALLCYKCNSVLGYAYEDVEILQNAIDYLNSFKG